MPYSLTIFQYHPAYFEEMLQTFFDKVGSTVWLNIDQEDYVLEDLSLIPLPQVGFPYSWEKEEFSASWHIHGFRLDSLSPNVEVEKGWTLRSRASLSYLENLLTSLEQTYSWSIFPWDNWNNDIPFVCIGFISSINSISQLFFETISEIKVLKEASESTSYQLNPLISNYFISNNFEDSLRGLTFEVGSYSSYKNLGDIIWDVCPNSQPWVLTDLYPGSSTEASDQITLPDYSPVEEDREAMDEVYGWGVEDFEAIQQLRISYKVLGLSPPAFTLKTYTISMLIDVIAPKNKKTLSRMCRHFVPSATELVLFVSQNTDLDRLQVILEETIVHYPHMEASLSYLNELLEATDWFCWLLRPYECGFFSRDNALTKSFIRLCRREKYQFTAFF
jgi:hypothetical protein